MTEASQQVNGAKSGKMYAEQQLHFFCVCFIALLFMQVYYYFSFYFEFVFSVFYKAVQICRTIQKYAFGIW